MLIQKTIYNKGTTLVEIITCGILGTILIVGVAGTLGIFDQHALALKRTVINPNQATYERLNGVVNHRLQQAWNYTFTDETNTIGTNEINTTKLYLTNATAEMYAYIEIRHTNGVNWAFQIKDTIPSTITPNPQNINYNFSSDNPTTEFKITLDTQGHLLWKIPPPYYITAGKDAFRGILPDPNITEGTERIKQSDSPILQHEITEYRFKPTESGLR